MPEEAPETTPTENAEVTEPPTEQAPVPTFTQADVDRMLGERARRERDRFADYDDLKASASRVPELEQSLERIRIAAEFGISTVAADGERSDAELFLTGGDAEAMRAQAKRLASRESDRRNAGNTVPNEGTNPPPKADPLREYTRNVFKSKAT